MPIVITVVLPADPVDRRYVTSARRRWPGRCWWLRPDLLYLGHEPFSYAISLPNSHYFFIIAVRMRIHIKTFHIHTHGLVFAIYSLFPVLLLFQVQTISLTHSRIIGCIIYRI